MEQMTKAHCHSKRHMWCCDTVLKNYPSSSFPEIELIKSSEFLEWGRERNIFSYSYLVPFNHTWVSANEMTLEGWGLDTRRNTCCSRTIGTFHSPTSGEKEDGSWRLIKHHWPVTGQPITPTQRSFQKAFNDGHLESFVDGEHKEAWNTASLKKPWIHTPFPPVFLLPPLITRKESQFPEFCETF